MLITTLSIIVAGITSFAVGRMSVKQKPVLTHTDTLRLDFLAKTRFWLLFNAERQAWAVMDGDNKPINARITVRDAIDAARVTTNG